MCSLQAGVMTSSGWWKPSTNLSLSRRVGVHSFSYNHFICFIRNYSFFSFWRGIIEFINCSLVWEVLFFIWWIGKHFESSMAFYANKKKNLPFIHVTFWRMEDWCDLCYRWGEGGTGVTCWWLSWWLGYCYVILVQCVTKNTLTWLLKVWTQGII